MTDPIDFLAADSATLKYEVALSSDSEWAMSEGSRHFENNSAVHKTLRDISTRLNSLGIPYAVAGGMALFLHGYRRFTEDVDILVDRPGLRRIHEELDGRGYLPPFAKSKNLRDTHHGVRIEFLVAGDFPGDGKPKPVAFPDPATAFIDLNGIHCLKLSVIVELKLASGMSNSQRLKDLADVQELIKSLLLPKDFSEELNPYVRPKYVELWNGVHQHTTRYVMTIPNIDPAMTIRSMDDLTGLSGIDKSKLENMQADGVQLDIAASAIGKCILYTLDREVADRHGFVDEQELWDEDDA